MFDLDCLRFKLDAMFKELASFENIVNSTQSAALTEKQAKEVAVLQLGATVIRGTLRDCDSALMRMEDAA